MAGYTLLHFLFTFVTVFFADNEKYWHKLWVQDHSLDISHNIVVESGLYQPNYLINSLPAEDIPAEMFLISVWILRLLDMSFLPFIKYYLKNNLSFEYV